jgi:hypothetical protein
VVSTGNIFLPWHGLRIYFAFWDDSGYIFWMTRSVWGPSFKMKKLVILLLLGVFFWCLWMQFWAIEGLLLATLSFVIYNVGYCF